MSHGRSRYDTGPRPHLFRHRGSGGAGRGSECQGVLGRASAAGAAATALSSSPLRREDAGAVRRRCKAGRAPTDARAGGPRGGGQREGWLFHCSYGCVGLAGISKGLGSPDQRMVLGKAGSGTLPRVPRQNCPRRAPPDTVQSLCPRLRSLQQVGVATMGGLSTALQCQRDLGCQSCQLRARLEQRLLPASRRRVGGGWSEPRSRGFREG